MGFFRKKTVLITLSVIVLAGIALGLWFVFSGFKEENPAEYYLEAETRHIKELSQKISEKYAKYYERRAPYINNNVSFTNQVDLMLDLEKTSIPGLDIPEGFAEILNNLGLNIKGVSDLSSRKMQSSVSVMIKSAPILDTTLSAGEEHILVSIPTLIPDTYFKFDSSRAVGLNEENYPLFINDILFGPVPVEPERFSTDLESILSRFLDIIKPYMDNNTVTFGQAEQMQAGGETVEITSILIKPGNTELARLMGDLKKWLVEEEPIEKLAGYILGENFGINGSLSELSGFIAANMDNVRDMAMEVYIDDKGNILYRNITWKIENPDSGGLFDYGFEITSLDAENTNMLDKGSFRFIYSIPGNGDEIITAKTTVITDFEPFSGGNSGKLNIVFETSDSREPFVNINASVEIDNTVNDTSGEELSHVKYMADIDYEGSKNSIYLSIDSVRQKNEKRNTRTTESEIDIDVKLPLLDIDSISAKAKVQIMEAFGTGEFTTEITEGKRIIDMNNLTEEELEQLQKEFAIAFGMFMFRHQSVFGGIF